MNKIEVKILNPEVIIESEKMMVTAARLTQRGHIIKNMNDFLDLYNKPYSSKAVQSMTALPHPTIQKFGVINVVVVGASRRFLAQITRHQNEVKFMSASLQYSDYSTDADFVVPYGIIGDEEKTKEYIDTCNESMKKYQAFASDSQIGNDEAGYVAPQSLRNILIISATPYQFKHMIRQRICRRNTLETRYVMLLIGIELQKQAPLFFENLNPNCCHEGKFSCGRVMVDSLLETYLETDFSKLKR